MKDFWNKRYAEQPYAYGTEPNAFFKSELLKLPSGHILLPCDGEGRNSVFAASQNWEVTAFDYSESAKEKALYLANEKGVKIDFSVCDVSDFSFSENKYDAVGLFFAHLPKELRKYMHNKIYSALKPGGTVIFEAFSKEQLNGYSSGGPKNIDMLFSIEDIKKEFSGFEFILLEKTETELSEGLYHQGKANVIRMVGRKL